MVLVSSLGIQTPAALPFLVAEQVLPEDATQKHYDWHVTYTHNGPTTIEDELVITESCVVWSRNAIVRRLFRFEAEGESVSQALFTTFPQTESSHSAKQKPTPGEISLDAEDQLKRVQASPSSNESRRLDPDLSRAVVVILQTQAHIFFLSGTNHIIHLPFEVEYAFPAPHGLVLQRKVSENPNVSNLAAPSSSFALQTPTQSRHPPERSNFTSQIYRETAPQEIFHGFANFSQQTAQNPLPSLFTVKDPLLELGLVAVNTNRNNPTRRASRKSLSPINTSERVLYISPTTELFDPSTSDDRSCDLILVLTADNETGNISVYNAEYLKSDPLAAQAKGKHQESTRSKRRSSFGPTTVPGAATPRPRHSTTATESFATSSRNVSQSAKVILPAKEDSSYLDPLVSSLDLEFDRRGAPAKDSRRVSSLLARVDLSTSHDKQTFSDLATGAVPLHGQAPGQISRRGESIGSQNPRASLGPGTSSNYRESMPRQTLFAQRNSIGHHDPPVDEVLDELNAGGDFEGFENMGLQEVVEGLQKELILSPVKVNPKQGKLILEKPVALERTKVFTLVEPIGQVLTLNSTRQLIICIVDQTSNKLFVLTFQVQRKQMNKPIGGQSTNQVLKFRELRTGTGVIDAVKVQDGAHSRILVLTTTADGQQELTLQAPWSPVERVLLPEVMTVWNPHAIGYSPLDTGDEHRLKRILSDKPKAIAALGSGQSHSSEGKVVVIDRTQRRHLLKIHMKPLDPQVHSILDVCRSILPPDSFGGEAVLVCWWQVKSWLQMSPEAHEQDSIEWTALIITIFSLIVPFIPLSQAQLKTQPRKAKRAFLRSSSEAFTDWTDWNTMLKSESDRSGPVPTWLQSSPWSWIASNTSSEARLTESPPRKIENAPYNNTDFLLDCLHLTREFIKSPDGIQATGLEGYLPTAPKKLSSLALPKNTISLLFVGLHLFREEQKLDTSKSDPKNGSPLLPVLAQLGTWLGWPRWGFGLDSYYSNEDVELSRWSYDSGKASLLELGPQPHDPPCIMEWICASLQYGMRTSFPTLDKLVRSVPSSASTYSQVFSGMESVGFWGRNTPRTYLMIKVLSSLNPAKDTFTRIVELISEAGVDQQLLSTLPIGITIGFQEAVYRTQPHPPTTWSGQLLHMVGRDDLNLLSTAHQKNFETPGLQLGPTHEAIRDCHTICNHTTDTEVVDYFDGSQELMRKSITRLIFKDDRRFTEASKLLGSLKHTIVRCEPEPDWSEAELLEAQKDLVQIVAIRTLAVPSGRGMFLFSARIPHRTEKYPLFGFNLTCVMRPSGNTVSADKSAFTEDKVCWAFFHAGVSAGLSIAREAKGIDTSWILYNKPSDLSNRHAGFLLALGLNGHLKSIAKWVAFKYLTPKHVMTSIGLLLGLSASFLGTMDSLVTRLLSVHVTRMLPVGAAELNLSPLTQTAGIMGIGLLYCGTQHRRMSEVMLSEVEYVDEEDPSGPPDSLRDEGYRLAAGFALGFINLGRGRDLKGLRDMQVVERLLGLSVGSRKVNLVHVLDRSMAAATVALALIFMKSNDEVLAKKVDVPETVLQFDYVRPDIFLLRTLARHLIMWDKITPTVSWIKASLPKAPEYAVNASLKRIERLSSANMALYNIVAGLCFAIGIRFAGTGDQNARELLIHYLDQLTRLCRLPAITYDQKLTRSTVRNCQDVLALSAATVMAGTGDLVVFRRLRSLHGRVDSDTPFGSHLAAHMAIGALFLGGGSYTFGTTDLAAGALLCAFYPLFPSDILDNRSHLQAFRHFWVLAVEPRCLVVQDAVTNRPVTVPIHIKLRDGGEITQDAPCLLPSIRTISSVTTRSLEYWQVVLDFANNQAHLDSFSQNQTIFLRRRVAHESSHSAFQANFLSISNREGEQHPLEWLFGLNALKGIGRSERGLILPLDIGSAAHINMESTVIDTRLMLNGYLHSGNRDKLWSIRMILEWAERMNARGETTQWLGVGEIERLRASVWTVGDNQRQVL
ncbi:MAG: Anaphase-promoting complex subunit 1 [Vezdaea aestivalis]|nr:MAG: Anaphase-promoting complex subunit 1 [Vezdaea aestivalis]